MKQDTVRSLHEDQRGAVMLTGLLMSCMLIGGLWFLIGIGDAIVFRQVMQEAPDHGGFTSAVLHAKGMNFIALCNMIMLVLITAYILGGIVHDIWALLCVTTGLACAGFAPVRTLWINYFNFMKPVCRALHVAEEVAAYGAPWLGAGVGAKVGMSYGEKATARKRDLFVMPLSTSMVPGRVGIPGRSTSAPSSLTMTGAWQVKTANGVNKYGLPVETKPFAVVCDKVSSMGMNLIGLSGKGAGGVASTIGDLIAGGVKTRYCGPFDVTSYIQSNDEKGKGIASVFSSALSPVLSWLKKAVSYFEKSGIGSALGSTVDPSMDSFWEEEGPLYVWGEASNGSVWMQIWTVNLMPSYGVDGKDTSFHRVGIASKRWGSASLRGKGDVKPRVYFSQAEFYYDCAASWADPDCHGPASMSNASYNMRWTTRMVAFDGNLNEVLGGVLGGVLGARFNVVYGALLDSPMLKPLTDYVPSWLGEVFTDEQGEPLLGASTVRDLLGLGTNGGAGTGVVDGLGGGRLNITPYH